MSSILGEANFSDHFSMATLICVCVLKTHTEIKYANKSVFVSLRGKSINYICAVYSIGIYCNLTSFLFLVTAVVFFVLSAQAIIEKCFTKFEDTDIFV